MLRGPGGGPEPVLAAAARAGRGPRHSFGAGTGRVAGVYGDGAASLLHALCGKPASVWRRQGITRATEVLPLRPGRGTVRTLLAAVASQFGAGSPVRSAAAVADAAELGDSRGRRLDDMSEGDLRCLSLAVAALTGARFVVVPRMDQGLGPREVAVLATAIGRCASELDLGIVFGAIATRNAFWADDVWHVSAHGGAERVSESACARATVAATVTTWVGEADFGY